MALAPIPYDAPIVEGGEDPISVPWYRWLFEWTQRVDAAAEVLTRVPLGNQGAAIGTTPIWVTTAAGLYSVRWYLRITTAAGVSSSVTVTIAWTDGGVNCSYTAPAVTGNTTATTQPDQQLLIKADGASSITYAVAYASNPAAVMKYSLDLVVEHVE